MPSRLFPPLGEGVISYNYGRSASVVLYSCRRRQYKHQAMDQAGQLIDSVLADDRYGLLDLLYSSAHEGQYRQEFIKALSGHLDLAIHRLYLYRLDQGSVLCYSQRQSGPLFEAVTDQAPGISVSQPLSRVGDLIVYLLDDGALAVLWSQGQTLIQLVGRLQGSLAPADFASQRAALLSYYLPHFNCLHDLFLKQRAQLPRLNAIRKIHAMLPLPLLIDRLDDEPLLNASAAEALSRLSSSPENKGRTGLSVEADVLPWKLHREGSAVSLLPLNGGSALPAFPLHHLPVGSGLYYDVYLLGGATLGKIPESLLNEVFNISPAEARICTCALAGQNPAEIAVALKLSINTVKSHLKSIYRRLQVHSVAQLAVRLYFHPAFWTARH